MKRSDELRDLKAQKVTTMRSVADGAKGRQLTAEERTNYDNLKKEIEALNQEIEDAAFLENEERHSAETQRTQTRTSTNGGEAGEMKRISKNTAFCGLSTGHLPESRLTVWRVKCTSKPKTKRGQLASRLPATFKFRG
jgi:HK97 family phage major capsid protein